MKYLYLFILSFIISSIIFLGCDRESIVEVVYAIEVKGPPPFSFLDCDPNSTSTEYVKRMKEYDKIMSLCSIPIYVMDQSDLPEKMLPTHTESKTFNGIYYSCNKDPSFPHEFIFLQKKSNPYDMMSTYFHEYQHLQCRLTKCHCRNECKISREGCAMRAELRTSIYRNDPFILLEAIDGIEKFSNCSHKNCAYKSAAQNIKKSELWKEAKIYEHTLLGVLEK